MENINLKKENFTNLLDILHDSIEMVRLSDVKVDLYTLSFVSVEVSCYNFARSEVSLLLEMSNHCDVVFFLYAYDGRIVFRFSSEIEPCSPQGLEIQQYFDSISW